jgi:hypothetical protein
LDSDLTGDGNPALLSLKGDFSGSLPLPVCGRRLLLKNDGTKFFFSDVADLGVADSGKSAVTYSGD